MHDIPSLHHFTRNKKMISDFGAFIGQFQIHHHTRRCKNRTASVNMAIQSRGLQRVEYKSFNTFSHDLTPVRISFHIISTFWRCYDATIVWKLFILISASDISPNIVPRILIFTQWVS
jgi:hypothetical protein